MSNNILNEKPKQCEINKKIVLIGSLMADNLEKIEDKLAMLPTGASITIDDSDLQSAFLARSRWSNFINEIQ